MATTPSPLKPTITKVTEELGTDANNKPATYVRITYMIGTHGPFSEKVLKTSFDPATVTAQLTAFAQKLSSAGAS